MQNSSPQKTSIVILKIILLLPTPQNLKVKILQAGHPSCRPQLFYSCHVVPSRAVRHLSIPQRKLPKGRFCEAEFSSSLSFLIWVPLRFEGDLRSSMLDPLRKSLNCSPGAVSSAFAFKHEIFKQYPRFEGLKWVLLVTSDRLPHFYHELCFRGAISGLSFLELAMMLSCCCSALLALLKVCWKDRECNSDHFLVFYFLETWKSDHANLCRIYAQYLWPTLNAKWRVDDKEKGALAEICPVGDSWQARTRPRYFHY